MADNKVSNTEIQKLMDESDILHSRQRKLTTAIKALQDVCTHDWRDNGYDSHKDHYICSVCGATDYV